MVAKRYGSKVSDCPYFEDRPIEVVEEWSLSIIQKPSVFFCPVCTITRKEMP